MQPYWLSTFSAGVIRPRVKTFEYDSHLCAHVAQPAAVASARLVSGSCLARSAPVNKSLAAIDQNGPVCSFLQSVGLVLLALTFAVGLRLLRFRFCSKRKWTFSLARCWLSERLTVSSFFVVSNHSLLACVLCSRLRIPATVRLEQLVPGTTCAASSRSQAELLASSSTKLLL
jgi:hypothetical protein